MAAKYEAKYMLIRWIGEENLSVVVAAKDKVGDPPFVGKIGDFKWAGKFYEGEVLALSDSRKDLNKTLKGLSELEITREDLLDNREAAGRTESSELGAPLPDTTTPDASPQKIVPPPIKKKRKLVNIKRKSEDATKSEAKTKSGTAAKSESMTKSQGKTKSEAKKKLDEKNAKIQTSKERARQMFKNSPYKYEHKQTEESSDIISQLKKELAALKKQVMEKNQAAATKPQKHNDTNQTTCDDSDHDDSWKDDRWKDESWNDDSWKDDSWKDDSWKDDSWKDDSWKDDRRKDDRWQDDGWKDDSRKDEWWKDGSWKDDRWQDDRWQDDRWQDDSWKDYGWKDDRRKDDSQKDDRRKDNSWKDSSWKDDSLPVNTSTPNRFTTKVTSREGQNSKKCKAESDQDENEASAPHFTVLPRATQIELVKGYGVYLAQRQLEEIEDQSYKSPTKLIRNLLTAFFKPTTLAESSCMGTRKYPPLNKDITRACFRFVMTKHPNVSRSTLVDAVNDKCANYRRKAKSRMSDD